jgi:hypothetical protein
MIVEYAGTDGCLLFEVAGLSAGRLGRQPQPWSYADFATAQACGVLLPSGTQHVTIRAI